MTSLSSSSSPSKTDAAFSSTSHLPAFTKEQLLQAERSHIFEVRIRQSEIIKESGNDCYKASLSSSNPLENITEASELYKRALHHVDFEGSQLNFELTDSRQGAIRRARAPLLLSVFIQYPNSRLFNL